MEAAIEVKEERSFRLFREIMIPLVGEKKELKFVKDVVVEVAEQVKKEKGSDIEYHIGTMIQIPRAALLANEIAEEAEFFSLGTNDLTQMTFGFSRDDAGNFLDAYYKAKIYESDPFARLDQNGVGQLVQMAADKGRSVRPDIKLGICGEHGGDRSSVEFCHKVGLTMYPAHHSVCRSQDWQQLRQRLPMQENRKPQVYDLQSLYMTRKGKQLFSSFPFFISQLGLNPEKLWLMYRSNWGTKKNQECILAIDIYQSEFDKM